MGAGRLAAALFLVCIGAYGLLLPRLGFYWDDWPWAWLEQLYGPQGMPAIDRLHRPLAGFFLALEALLAGGRPAVWQALNLGLRFLGSLALVWALVQIWPGGRARAAWAGLLFVVYPAFQQQFIAINSSRHLLPLAGFFLSVGLMAAAQAKAADPDHARGKNRARMAGAWLLALASMLTSEYVYGLELLRPVVLWIVTARLQPGEAPPETRPRLGRALKAWLPFAALLLAVFAWRYQVSQRGNYPVSLAFEVAVDPAGGLAAALMEIAGGAVQALLAAWGLVLDFPGRADLGLRGLGLFWALTAAVCALVFFAVRHYGDSAPEKREDLQRLLLGELALLAGGLPFVAAGLPINLRFPSDRAMLPLLPGACLFWSGLLGLLPFPRQAKLAVLALAVGLGAGYQHRVGLDYAREWQEQRAFFQQLAWRAPDLAPGTALVTQQFKFDFSSDNSLTAALNWMYDPEAPQSELPLMLFYLNLRLGGAIPALESGRSVNLDYGPFTFSGSTDAALLLHHNPPDCLRVLDPQVDAQLATLPPRLRGALELSNLERILPTPARPAALPAVFGPPEAAPGWCYYFEQADLARQLGDWEAAAALGLEAQAQGLGPFTFSELGPFILAFGHTGRWDEAFAWSLEALEKGLQAEAWLCSLWDSLRAGTQDSVEKQRALERIEERLACR